MRTRPSSTPWAWVYAALYFLQMGWPALAANAAGAIFFLFARRLAGHRGCPATSTSSASATFLMCVAILLVGRRIERTLELLNWVLVGVHPGRFLVLALLFVPAPDLAAARGGLRRLRRGARHASTSCRRERTSFCSRALVAYSGAGGVANITLSNWARDKGYGMGERVGYIPAAVGGEKVRLAHSGFMFTPDADGHARWRGWWRVVRADQWGVFFTGAILGMLLPAMLYVTLLPSGTDIRGLGISAALASGRRCASRTDCSPARSRSSARGFCSRRSWTMEGMVRAITDMLWTGSRRIRAWRGGDVRAVYYAVLAAVLWGVIALRLAQPIVLLQLAANIAGVVLVISSLHLLYVNTRLLPVELRPPTWRRVALVAMALFYGFFLVLSLSSLR